MKKGSSAVLMLQLASSNVKKHRKRKNSAVATDDKKETHESNDIKQEHNYLTTEISANNTNDLTQADIQNQLSVQDKLSQFSTFAGHKITKSYGGEKIKKGARVVKREQKITSSTQSAASSNRMHIGTISSVASNGTQIYVQWDDLDPQQQFSVENYQFDLLLFDNAQTGVKHTHYPCNACGIQPLSGIRWKCLNCVDIDLCTLCYMSDAHDVSHIFNRIESEDSKGEKVPPREDIQWTGFKYVCGIRENADVSLRNNNSKTADHKVGNVLKEIKSVRGCEDLCEQDMVDDAKEQNKDKDTLTKLTKDIEVQWDKDYEISRHNVLELKCETPALHPCYPDHLPILENDTRGQLDVEYCDDKREKKISVDIWYRTKTEKKDSYKPLLYLIFANGNRDEKIKDKKRFAIMNEVLAFSRRTKLPCHVVGQKVLFHHGSPNAVFIHHETSNDTIKELVRKGCLILQRGDTDENESKVDYFMRMAEYVLGVDILPVIVSLGDNFEDISVVRSWIPILQFKKKSLDIGVFTTGQDNQTRTEYKTNLKTPWNAKQTVTEENTTDVQNQDKISGIYDVKSNFDFEVLICYVVIGVAMVSKDKNNSEIEDYANALSMYLLKNGKWRIPKECINESFEFRSVEYIYEEDCTMKVKNGLMTDLQEFRSSFKLSPHDIREGKEITNAELKPELYGMIFFALLKKEFYTGARQLVETGYVRIHHILVGCQLLHQVANDWKTSHIQKENLTRLKEAFTQRAIQITRCIYETERKIIEDQNATGKYEKELGEPVGHAGRLLLNHGYLEDAITTENKTFIGNDTVSRILNKMWYGEENLSWRQVWCFILLACVHLLIMPLLMISMEYGPLKWFYKKYKLPFMKVITQMFGYFVLLILYAYMLLFNLHAELSYTDILILGWMVSFVINETKQALVSFLRNRFRNYVKDSWNQLDWILIVVYTVAMSLKFGKDQSYQDTSKIFLVVTFILFSIRILHMFSMSKFLGPKLVIIHKMFKDTFIFMIILTVIMVSYNVSFHSMLYPNSELEWKEIEKIIQNGYWMLFGELNLDSDTLKEPECTFNKTIYTDDVLPRCPSSLGLHVSPYLKAIYGLIAVILLLNLLIAIYSDTFEKVQQESEFHWSQLRTGFLEELSVKTIFPIHLQLLELPACFIHFMIWCVVSYFFGGKNSNEVHPGGIKDGPVNVDTLNDKPMFVRVFLYNTNFDLRLPTTRAAEERGASKSKGVIEVEKEDTIKILEKKIEIQISRLKHQHNKMLEGLKNITKYLQKPNKLKKQKKIHRKKERHV